MICFVFFYIFDFMKPVIDKKYLQLLLLLVLMFTSCRTQKEVVYNPQEVRLLSRQMGFDIDNRDANIPLYAEVSFWLGTPYQGGGASRRGADCSGFTMRVYERVYQKKIARTTTGLDKSTKKVSKGKLQTGDFVFFATSRKSKQINHVGIYLKEGYFIHASTSRGVIVSRLDEEYYKRTWRKGGRLK